jgi:mediator of RNA polymerase II transcription subunit 12, fungi type
MNTENDDMVDYPPASLAQFNLIKDCLEELGDHPILADILCITIPTAPYNILTAICETLDYHSVSIAAIGALVGLMSTLTERYLSLRTERLPDRRFLTAALELCSTVQVEPTLVQILKGDLQRIELQASAAVCSPASDNIVSITQSSSVETDDDIDRMLSSGTSMDEQIMGRMFTRISSRFSDEIIKDSRKIAVFTNWFPRLRAFDEKTFDTLAQEWIYGLFLEQKQAIFQAAIPILLISSCLTFEDLVACSNKILPVLARRSRIAAAKMAKEVAMLLLPFSPIDEGQRIFVGFELPPSLWLY